MPMTDWSSSLGMNLLTRTLPVPSVRSNWSTDAPSFWMVRLSTAKTRPETITVFCSGLAVLTGEGRPLMARPRRTFPVPGAAFFFWAGLSGSAWGQEGSIFTSRRPNSAAMAHSMADISAGAGIAENRARMVMSIRSLFTVASSTNVSPRLP